MPQASTSAIDADDAPYEVEVVVDFGVTVVEYPALTAASIAAHSNSTAAPSSAAQALATRTGSTATATPSAPMAVPAGSASTQAQAQPKSIADSVQNHSQKQSALDAKSGSGNGGSAKGSGRRGSVGPDAGDGGNGDVPDNMSDVSENWAEDRYAPETPEEKQVSGCCCMN